MSVWIGVPPCSGLASVRAVWYFYWRLNQTNAAEFEESDLKIITIIVLCAAVLAGMSPPSSSEDVGMNTIQLVYHSDTRGYYLPCG